MKRRMIIDGNKRAPVKSGVYHDGIRRDPLSRATTIRVVYEMQSDSENGPWEHAVDFTNSPLDLAAEDWGEQFALIGPHLPAIEGEPTPANYPGSLLGQVPSRGVADDPALENLELVPWPVGEDAWPEGLHGGVNATRIGIPATPYVGIAALLHMRLVNVTWDGPGAARVAAFILGSEYMAVFSAADPDPATGFYGYRHEDIGWVDGNWLAFWAARTVEPQYVRIEVDCTLYHLPRRLGMVAVDAGELYRWDPTLPITEFEGAPYAFGDFVHRNDTIS